MAWFAYVAMAAGAVMKGQAAKQQSKSEAALLEYNAALKEREAKLKRLNTAEAQKLKREEMRKTLATNRAITGASGVQMKGSPAAHQLDVIDDFAYDIALTGQEGEIQAQRYESQAHIYRMQAKSARRRGKIGFMSSMLEGMGNIGSTYARLNN